MSREIYFVDQIIIFLPHWQTSMRSLYEDGARRKAGGKVVTQSVSQTG